jgi:hypothetical protein
MRNKKSSFAKMKKATLVICLLVFAIWNLFSQLSDFPRLTSPYVDQKPTGITPEIFFPGIVSTDACGLHGTFSPDGEEFFFARRASLEGYDK